MVRFALAFATSVASFMSCRRLPESMSSGTISVNPKRALLENDVTVLFKAIVALEIFEMALRISAPFALIRGVNRKRNERKKRCIFGGGFLGKEMIVNE